jgi:hypothetical protein
VRFAGMARATFILLFIIDPMCYWASDKACVVLIHNFNPSRCHRLLFLALFLFTTICRSWSAPSPMFQL